MIEKRKRITLDMVRKNPETLFVIGDIYRNPEDEEAPTGILAEANVAGMPNARSKKVGLEDRDYREWYIRCTPPLYRILDHLDAGGRVVWHDGISDKVTSSDIKRGFRRIYGMLDGTPSHLLKLENDFHSKVMDGDIWYDFR